MTDIPTDPVIEAVRADLLRCQQLGYLKYGLEIEKQGK